ncbi:MAG: T9SS type A sorting domain-containing protein [Flavobacteriales bacterium]
MSILYKCKNGIVVIALKPGIYFLQIESSGELISTKFIKR